MRPCAPAPAHTSTRTVTPGTLGEYPARIAVDCIITLALFKAVPLLEMEITQETLAELGPRPRRSCVTGTVLRLTRERAEREGWPWPSFDDVIERLASQPLPVSEVVARLQEGGAR